MSHIFLHKGKIYDSFLKENIRVRENPYSGIFYAVLRIKTSTSKYFVMFTTLEIHLDKKARTLKLKGKNEKVRWRTIYLGV